MKFYMPFIIVVLGIGWVTSTASAQDQIDYTEMVEDLKVMCRIIDETMHETFENDYVKGVLFRRAGCQHLYLKGYGAVFLLDVQFPVTEKEMKVAMKEKKTDLWEKYEREVRYQHRPEGEMWVVGNDESYSKEKVDKLKEQLAYLVGEYGSRIGQLEFNDTISFVVFGFSDHTVDLETDIMGFATHVVELGNVDAMPHPRETIEETKEKLLETAEQILEAKKKLEGMPKQESRDDDKFVIPIPPTPPMLPSFPHRLHRKPATTLILTFKRSHLEGKKGTDWETLLEAAEVVEY